MNHEQREEATLAALSSRLSSVGLQSPEEHADKAQPELQAMTIFAAKKKRLNSFGTSLEGADIPHYISRPSSQARLQCEVSAKASGCGGEYLVRTLALAWLENKSAAFFSEARL